MATIYSKKLAAGSQNVAGTNPIYTAPASGLIIVRSVQFILYSGATQGGIFVAASSAYIVLANGLAVDNYLNEDLRVVLDPGDVLYASSAGGGCSWYLSGYELDA